MLMEAWCELKNDQYAFIASWGRGIQMRVPSRESRVVLGNLRKENMIAIRRPQNEHDMPRLDRASYLYYFHPGH